MKRESKLSFQPSGREGGEDNGHFNLWCVTLWARVRQAPIFMAKKGFIGWGKKILMG